VAPEQTTNAGFTKVFARAVSRPAFLSVPPLLLKLALGKAAQMVYLNPRVVPAKLDQLSFQFEFPSIEQAIAEITSG